MVAHAPPPPAPFSDYDPNSLAVALARKFILQYLTPVSDFEQIELAGALHRTLASDIESPLDVPAFDNSAMDGYGLRHQDFANGITSFKLAGSAFAGHAFKGALGQGECVRIMTGAAIPVDCNCVVMQEQADVSGSTVTIKSAHRPGENIRRMGEDIHRGEVVLKQGQALRPAEMGLLASLGLNHVSVYRRLRVALFSTGDELQQPGQPLLQGQIYDSNRYSLLGMLQQLDVEIMDMGCIRDDPASLKRSLTSASMQADVIITSGGVSVGEADHIKQLLQEIGQIMFWKIAMKPGRPLAYGKIGNCHFFGLPGNPVAVMVTFIQFVQDALKILMGRLPSPSFTFPVACTSPIRKIPGRMEFQRGILSRNEQGELEVSVTGNQGSGILSSMSRANCFIVLPEDQGDVLSGSLVQVQPFPR